jgi:hypothetical protein
MHGWSPAVNLAEAPRNNEDVTQLFRDMKALGADSSLWLRVLRQLTSEGKPIGRMYSILVPVSKDQKLPIGVVTLTDNNRLVFWPVLPRKQAAFVDRPDVQLLDHITVDFPSERVHITSYNSQGKPNRFADSWRSATTVNEDLRLLFSFNVRLDTVRSQDVLISRSFPVPDSDSDRRTAEFARCLEKFVMLDLPFEEDAQLAQFASIAVYHSAEELEPGDFPASMLPMPDADALIEPVPAGYEYKIFVGRLLLNDKRIYVAGGFPPGELKDDLCFGFPTRRRDRR